MLRVKHKTIVGSKIWNTLKSLEILLPLANALFVAHFIPKLVFAKTIPKQTK